MVEDAARTRWRRGSPDEEHPRVVLRDAAASFRQRLICPVTGKVQRATDQHPIRAMTAKGIVLHAWLSKNIATPTTGATPRQRGEYLPDPRVSLRPAERLLV